MSFTFALSGNSSTLNYDFNPPIYLEDDCDYEIGLTNLDTFNSIPNVDETNNKFQFGENQKNAEIPAGTYEFEKIIQKMTDQIQQDDDEAVVRITADVHSSKITIRTNRKINFKVKDSIGPLLGFGEKLLEADNTYTSDTVQISKVNTICIDCNIAAGSYLNGRPVHIIHQFFPSVPAGYKIVESPINIIYFPVSVKAINNITVSVLDQDLNILNLRKETISVRLHVRKVKI